MVAKFFLVASLAAALILCATAELPTEHNSALASEEGLEVANSALEFEENFAEIEELRQKREALPEPKKEKKNSSRKNKGKKSKSKGKKKSDAKRKAKNKKSKNNKGKDASKNRRKNKKGKGNKKKASTNTVRKKNKKGKKGIRNNKKRSGKKKNGKKNKDSKNVKGKRNNNNKRKKNKDSIKAKGKRNNKKKGKKNKDKRKAKGQRNNKNKGKKNKESIKVKGKRNNKNKEKKNKDSRKEKGKRNNKKNKKGKKKINLRKSKPKKKYNQRKLSRQNATVSLTCLKDAVLYTKFLKDQVINFLRRNTRLEAQNKLTSKKALKKGEFEEPMARVIQAGGGDRQNLSCGGSTKSAGAKQMKNITDILGSCNDNIKAACKPHKGNVTERELCVTNAKKFNTTIVGCVATAIKGQDACSCFQAAEVAKEKKILESCKGTSDAKKAATARTKCLKTLSKCKQAQTTAGTLQYSCGYSEQKLLGILKQLSVNLAAFKKLLEKIEKLTGVKADPPGGGNSTSNRSRTIREEIEEENSQKSRNRGKRQTGNKPCADVLVTLSTCTTAISNAPSLPSTADSCKEPTYTITACSEDEKVKVKAALNAAIITNGLIIGFIESVKAELKANTGSTPSDDQISASTKKTAARSRSILRKMIMEKMQLHN